MSDTGTGFQVPSQMEQWLHIHPEDRALFERDLLNADRELAQEAARLAGQEIRERQPPIVMSKRQRIRRTGTARERAAIRDEDDGWEAARQEATGRRLAELRAEFAEQWLSKRVELRLLLQRANEVPSVPKSSAGSEGRSDESAPKEVRRGRRRASIGVSNADKTVLARNLLSETLCAHHYQGEDLNPEPLSLKAAADVVKPHKLARYQAEKFFNDWMGRRARGWSAYAEMCGEPGLQRLRGKLEQLADPSRLQFQAAQGIPGTPQTVNLHRCETCGRIITAEEVREYGECLKCRSPELVEL